MARKAIKEGETVQTYQERRRQEALLWQREARKAKTDEFRLAVTAAAAQDENEALEAEMLDAGGSSKARLHALAAGASQAKTGPRLIDGVHPRQFYAGHFMHPEWMTDIPPDLATNWSVRVRPQGRRCLVVSFRGRTVSRQRTGAVVHTFTSLLPEGSEHNQSGTHQHCMLDCVFDEDSSIYWVLDVLRWRGCSVVECSAEFRMFWLATKLEEEGVLGPVGEEHQYRFGVVSVYPCTPEGLLAAYTTPCPYQKDGLLLLHNQGHYSEGTISPLALLWKDPQVSQYWLDTDAHGVVPEHQQVTLYWQADCSLVTSDETPVVVGALSGAALELLGSRLRPGRLLRLSIQDGGMQLEHGVPVSADLRFEGVANQRKGRADIWSKILFQYNARRRPLLFDELVAAAKLSVRGAEEEVQPPSSTGQDDDVVMTVDQQA